jgi:recombinational DNA repair protein (RecF pathway)
VSRSTVHGHGQSELFGLLDPALDFLCGREPGPAFLLWFELSLMARIGLAPRLAGCPVCRRPLRRRSTRSSWLSCRHGGIICADCRESYHGDLLEVAPDVLAMLRQWQEAVAPHSAHNTRCSDRQLQAAHTVLGTFLRYHLDADLPSRDIVLQVLTLDMDRLCA